MTTNGRKEVEKLTLDVDVRHWPLSEQYAYEEAVGVMPAEALLDLESAFAGMDEEGEEVPRAALTRATTEKMAGFVWIPARREYPLLDFKTFCAEIDSEALYAAYAEAGEVEARPDPTTGAESSPAVETSSPSAPSTSGAETTC